MEEAKMTNEELAAAIAAVYQLAGSVTEAGRMMTDHLKVLLDIQLERAKAKLDQIDRCRSEDREMIEFRWVLPDSTTTRERILQYRAPLKIADTGELCFNSDKEWKTVPLQEVSADEWYDIITKA